MHETFRVYTKADGDMEGEEKLVEGEDNVVVVVENEEQEEKNQEEEKIFYNFG